MPKSIYKKKFILISLISFLVQHCIAQEIVKAPEFGKIKMSELQLKECSFEPGASAMILSKFESVELIVSAYGDLKLITETTCRIKIFDKSGYKNANIIIPYMGKNRTSKITDVEGSTYNLDGGKIMVSDINKKEIFRDKSAEKNGLNTVRFTFPDVRPGSVIEYRFTRIEKKSFFITPWFFQSDIPTLFSACKITTPSLTHLDTKIIASIPVEEGSHEGKNNSSYWNRIQKSFAMRNIPSFKIEPFMSSLKDNLQRAEFALIPQIGLFSLFKGDVKWRLINSFFVSAPFFGQQFDKPIPGTENFIDSLKHIDSVPDKINAVYQYVKRNVGWDNHQTFFADDIAEVWKNKEGNSAEINLIILNLLRKTNVNCYPILISTRENGKVDIGFPNPSQFNGVDILAFNGDDLYILDGAQKNISYKVPPLNVLNRDAFVIDIAKSKWVNLEDTRTLLQDSVAINGTINEDGSFKGEAVITYYDLSRAVKIEKDNKEEKEKTDDYLLTDAPDLKIDTSYEEDKDNELKPLREVIKFHYDLPSTDQFYFLNPYVMSAFKKNPFTDSVRRTDLDFGANSSFLLHMEINLPQQIKVEELTKNKIIRTPDSILFFKRFNELDGNKLIVNSRFDINQAIFSKENYPGIVDFFQNVYAILNQQILLKKED